MDQLTDENVIPCCLNEGITGILPNIEFISDSNQVSALLFFIFSTLLKVNFSKFRSAD